MKTARLSEVCKLVNGGTPKSGVTEYWGGDVAWLTPAEMGKRTTPYIAETARTISQIGLSNCSARQVPVGAVIMSTRAPIGHLAIPETPMAFNQGCRGLIPNESLDTKYLYYFLWFSRDALNDLGTGATFKELSSGALGNYSIPLPPLEVQWRIVAVLDEAFAAIATATANAEKNLANARELFDARAESIFLQRGEGWKDVPLGGVCDFLNGFAFKSSDAVEKSHTQLVRMGNLYGRNLDLERKGAFYPDQFASEYERFTLAEGDIIISLTGTMGKEDYGFAVRVPPTDRVLLMNQRIAKFDRVNDRLVNRDYLLLFLRSRSFLDVLYPTANGTRQANLSTVTMKTIPVPLCPIPMQEAIVSSLNVLADESTRLAKLYRTKLDALNELRNALLHRAFTGELTATMPETIAA